MMLWWWLAGLGLLGLAAFLLLASRIRFRLYIKREKQDDRISLHVRALFGLIRKEYEWPKIQWLNWWEGIVLEMSQDLNSGKTVTVDQNKLKKGWQIWQNALRHTKGLKKWLRVLLSHVRCTEFAWKTGIGFHDAPATAVLVGFAWFVKYAVVRTAMKWVAFEKRPAIAVEPHYNEEVFRTELTCTGVLSLGAAIAAACALFVRITKGKNGWRTWYRIAAGK